MGNSNQPTFPEETVITNTTTTTSSVPPTPAAPVQPTTQVVVNEIKEPKSSSGKGRTLATLFGIVLLVLGLGAGIVLVGQRQLINQQAAVPAGCTATTTNNVLTLGGTCPGSIVTYNGPSCPTTANRITSTDDTTGGPFTPNPPADGCQQIDYDPSTDPGQGVGVCRCAGGGGGTSTPGPIERDCGEACTTDAQCKATNSAGVCRSGMCVNVNCPTQTAPGKNCACTNEVQCGQQPLFGQGCAGGSDNGLINVTNKNNCDSYTTSAGSGVSSHEYCIPFNPTHGYKRIVSCTDLQAHNLAKPDGSITGLTQQDVLTACSAEATPTPTATATASPIPGTASCSNIKAYDTNWNLLSNSDLQALAEGTHVFFTVSGTTSSSFDKAQFTINGTQTPETVTTKPGASQEFYYDYTIPASTTSFTVTAQIHDSGTNQWY